MGLASGLLDATGQLEDVPCNLCGADDYSVIRPARYSHADAGELSQRFRSSGDEVLIDQLVRCQRCGLQYVSPRLRLEFILEGYSSAVHLVLLLQTNENFAQKPFVTRPHHSPSSNEE